MTRREEGAELPQTERRSGIELDRASPLELARVFQAADRDAAAAVAKAEAAIARAIELAGQALAAGGRVVLLGAGTSGRLAVIEAAECLPTFGSTRVVGLIAGGPGAFLRAKEGAEDSAAGGAEALSEIELEPRDFVIGVAASGRTPYVHGALEEAARRGAPTALLCASPPPPERAPAIGLVILLETGPEVLSGSTRLKAGTATKCALNAITTGAMATRGKVYGDLMVDVQATNQKLVVRAERIVRALTDLEAEAARAAIAAAGGEVKTAVVMGRLGLGATEARARLASADGHLRRCLDA